MRKTLLSSLLVAFAAPSCAVDPSIRVGADPLADAFAEIGATYLDIASNPDELADCVDKRNYSCLSNYKTQRAAVRRIFDRGREAALGRAIDMLKMHCVLPEREQGRNGFSPWQTCAGAANVIFFFYKPAEDDEVRNAFAQFDQKLIRHIFVDAYGCGPGFWCNNRPDKEAWLNLIESWTILDEADGPIHGREGLKEIFSTPPPPPRSSWMLLLDPEYHLDKKLEARIDATMKSSKYYAQMQRQIRGFWATPKSR